MSRGTTESVSERKRIEIYIGEKRCFVAAKRWKGMKEIGGALERFKRNFLISRENKYLNCASARQHNGKGGGREDFVEWFLSFLTSTTDRTLWDISASL